MLSELAACEKVVGVKQVKRALRGGRVRRIYFALDAEQRVLEPVLDLCRERHIPVRPVPAMSQLGEACGISVGAAVVAQLTGCS